MERRQTFDVAWRTSFPLERGWRGKWWERSSREDEGRKIEYFLMS